MEVKVKYLRSDIQKPEYATSGSVGMDLAAAVDAPVVIKAGEREMIPTGIALQIPEGYAGFVFARSGLAMKKGITMANSVGVIDNDYTGEIQLAMLNVSSKDYTVNPGDRIAQLLFLPVERARLLAVDTLEETERGAGGFGSTGI